MKMKTVFYFVPMIIMMVVIFSFSAQPANESSEQSSFIVSLITKTDIGAALARKTDNLELIVRKLAHFSEYGFFAVTVLFGAAHTAINRKRLYPLCECIAFLYACSDEIHQYFVPGRSMAFTDVCIDSAGALFWLVIVYFVMKLINRRTRKRN